QVGGLDADLLLAKMLPQLLTRIEFGNVDPDHPIAEPCQRDRYGSKKGPHLQYLGAGRDLGLDIAYRSDIGLPMIERIGAFSFLIVGVEKIEPAVSQPLDILVNQTFHLACHHSLLMPVPVSSNHDSTARPGARATTITRSDRPDGNPAALVT